METNADKPGSRSKVRGIIAALAVVLAISAAFNLFLFDKSNGIDAYKKKLQELQAHTDTLLEAIKTAEIQSRISSQQQEIAKQYQNLAQIATDTALKAQKKAEEETERANNEKNEKVIALQNVTLLKDTADTNAAIAVRNQKKAEEATAIAGTETKKAVAAKEKAYQLRQLLIARALALQSVKLGKGADKDLPALLARQAYLFNKDSGSANDPDIFNALSGVTDDKLVLTGFKDAVRSISLSGDGTLLAGGSDDKTIKLWRKKQNGFEQSGTFSLNEEVRSICLSDDGHYLMAGTVSGFVYLWDLRDSGNKYAPVNKDGATISKIIYVPSPGIFISAAANGFIRAWKPSPFIKKSMHGSSSVLPIANELIIKEDAGVKCLAYNNSRLVAGCQNGKICLFQPAQTAPYFTVAKTFTDPSGEILSIAMDEGVVATGGNAGSICIWDLKNMTSKDFHPRKIIGHKSGVTALCFYPSATDFPLLASASYDKTIRICSMEDLDENPVVIRDNVSWVMDLLYSSHDNSIISAEEASNIRIFNVDQEKMAEKICSRLTRNFKRTEWKDYVGKDIEYKKTCDNLPEGK